MTSLPRPWSRPLRAIIRWANERDTSTDKIVLGQLVGYQNLIRWGKSDRGFWAGELLNAVMHKYARRGVNYSQVDTAVEATLDTLSPHHPSRRRHF